MPEQQGSPSVQGRCPACGGAGLFLGSGGHVTCPRLDCPNPSGADELLHQRAHDWSSTEQPAPVPEGCGCGTYMRCPNGHCSRHYTCQDCGNCCSCECSGQPTAASEQQPTA